jgi:SAM-dependent MidA family methyltransferase
MSLPEVTTPSPLAARLREEIRRAGAISFRDWMFAALYDEREGYYCRADRARWGRTASSDDGGGGDYRTSPERSPLFAATFARYFAALYTELGSPAEWTILEAGAGAGDFARVVLETLEHAYPRVFQATRYCIEEISGDALARVRENLAAFSGRVEFGQNNLRGQSYEAGVIFSNELLDALPVHRVSLRGGVLRELYVGLDAKGDFIWIEGEPTTPRLAAYFSRHNITLAEGQFAEVNLAAEEWIADAASTLKRGYLITVDYGVEAAALYHPTLRSEGTLRGFRAHQFVADLLAHPGEHDLTTTINWTALKQAGEAAGLETISLERQDEFLLRAGLIDELERLTAQLPTEAERLRLRLGAREMILPEGMSQSFQVLLQKKQEA